MTQESGTSFLARARREFWICPSLRHGGGAAQVIDTQEPSGVKRRPRPRGSAATPWVASVSATLPSTKPWLLVVHLLEGRAADEDVIRASAIAAERALSGAAPDPTLVSAVHLLAMVPQAARTGRSQSVRHAGRSGPRLADARRPGRRASFCARAASVRAGTRTNFSEIARRALLGTLITTADGTLPGLFEADAEDVRTAVAGLGQPRGFRGRASLLRPAVIGHTVLLVGPHALDPGRSRAALRGHGEA